jgi:hypothetical protein
MVEAREEKKKAPGVARRVLKWFGLGVVCVLLLGAVVFAAPWKVTTLLVIILAACTVLPRPARKWFWAGVGVVILALIVWVFLPESDSDWRAYTFDEESAALEAKRAIPDEENAARIYNELLDSYDSNSFYLGLAENEVEKIPMREPWLSDEHPQIAAWVEGHQTTISMLLNAATMEKCRFPINANLVSFDYTMDRTSRMRKWAYLLRSAANNDIAEGRKGEALEKYVAVLQMGKHQRQQPSIIDFLAGVALESLAIGEFKRFIITDSTTDEHLIVIEKALKAIKYDWSTDFPRFLEHDKLIHKNLWGMLYGVNPEGKIRLMRGFTKTIMAQLPEDMKDAIEGETALAYWRGRLMKGHTILAWFYMPSSPQRAGEIIDAAYERFDAMAKPDFDWKREPRRFSLTSVKLNYRGMVDLLVRVMEPAYDKIHNVYLQVKARDKRGSQIIVALRRYKNENGQWPETLDELRDFALEEIFIDPINGGSFVYKLTDDGFALYSKGKNSVDDGAERDDETGADDWLIWPPKSRKAKEENADDEQ